MISIKVNGQVRDVDVEPDTPLLWVLREQLGLTGTKFGCGVSMCGACTVHVDGFPTRSCITKVSTVVGVDITTIEGIAPEGELHPVQKAWIDEEVPQCGYCQSGQIMVACSLLKEVPQPSDAEIAEAVGDTLCRCGAYNQIRAAIKRAAAGGQR
jgi:isoquinoline 1-oxidoreductase subunit alpha